MSLLHDRGIGFMNVGDKRKKISPSNGWITRGASSRLNEVGTLRDTNMDIKPHDKVAFLLSDRATCVTDADLVVDDAFVLSE